MMIAKVPHRGAPVFVNVDNVIYLFIYFSRLSPLEITSL